LGTRVVSGQVVAQYTGGGGLDSVRAGAIPAGLLSVAQARVLLALLLDHYPAAEAARLFSNYVKATAAPAPVAAE
jgi:L-asparaginase